MMRKKSALHLDSRYSTIIENAYYYCNPPEVTQEAKKQRPPMHEYIRKLLFRDLSKLNTEKASTIKKKYLRDSTIIKYICQFTKSKFCAESKDLLRSLCQQIKIIMILFLSTAFL